MFVYAITKFSLGELPVELACPQNPFLIMSKIQPEHCIVLEGRMEMQDKLRLNFHDLPCFRYKQINHWPKN